MARGRKQSRTQNEDGTVTCSCCGLDKEIDDFYKDSERPLGIQWYCKKCNAEKAKKRWQENKNKKEKKTIFFPTWQKELDIQRWDRYKIDVDVEALKEEMERFRYGRNISINNMGMPTTFKTEKSQELVKYTEDKTSSLGIRREEE